MNFIGFILLFLLSDKYIIYFEFAGMWVQGLKKSHSISMQYGCIVSA